LMYQALVSVHDHSMPSVHLGGGRRQVAYSMPIPLQLLGTPLTMEATVVPGGLVPVNPAHYLQVEQVAGPRPVELTTQHLVQTGVDFAVTDNERPK
jgi:hypothetical protein